MTDPSATALSRLLSQFDRSSILRTLVEGTVYPADDTANAILDFAETALSVDDSFGVWLDMLGEIVGVSRPFEPVPYSEIFQFREHVGNPDDPDMGFYDAGPPITGGYFQNGPGISLTDGSKIDDDTYRRLIKAKAIATNTDGTYRDIYDYIVAVIGSDSYPVVLTSPEVGLVEIDVQLPLDQYMRNMVLEDSPRMAGVEYIMQTWYLPEPI